MTVKKKLDPFNIVTGQKLKDFREKNLDITIAAFAENTGLSSKTISNYENGRYTLPISTLIAIYESGLFNMSLEYLCKIFIVSTYDEIKDK